MSDYSRKYKDLAKEIVLSFLNQDEFCIFLFGSRAGETDASSSDLDIGIWGDRPLGKIRHRIIKALEESIIPYKIDLVDFYSVEDSFKKEALKEIEIWNLPPGWSVNSRSLNKR